MYYSISQVAEMLSLNRRTIFNWIKAGKIEAIWLNGTRWRIPKTEVDRILRGEEHAAG